MAIVLLRIDDRLVHGQEWTILGRYAGINNDRTALDRVGNRRHGVLDDGTLHRLFHCTLNNVHGLRVDTKSTANLTDTRQGDVAF